MKSFLALLSFVVIRVIGFTLRMTVEDFGRVCDQPEHPPVIIAFWHNRTALMAYFYERFCRGRTALTFISRSRDGQFITNVAAHFGIKAVRGSSSRHGTSAMLTAIRASKDDHIDIVITPDGPRGPRYEIQPGLVRLAQMTQRPIVAVTYRLKWKWELRSWDRFQIAVPFSTCHLITSERILVPESASETELKVITARIYNALNSGD
jgi:lysophospholipid acyltransferase (LPLAT)-like uncharacterized protein